MRGVEGLGKRDGGAEDGDEFVEAGLPWALRSGEPSAVEDGEWAAGREGRGKVWNIAGYAHLDCRAFWVLPTLNLRV